MSIAVVKAAGSHRLQGDWEGVEVANGYSGHLQARAFSPAMLRAYAFDLMCFGRFCAARRLRLAAVAPTDIFEWVVFQIKAPAAPGQRVVPLGRRGTATRVVLFMAQAPDPSVLLPYVPAFTLQSDDLIDCGTPAARCGLRRTGLRQGESIVVTAVGRVSCRNEGVRCYPFRSRRADDEWFLALGRGRPPGAYNDLPGAFCVRNDCGFRGFGEAALPPGAAPHRPSTPSTSRGSVWTSRPRPPMSRSTGASTPSPAGS